MDVSLAELEASWAGCASAVEARFVRARSVFDALRQLGMIGPADRIVAARGDLAASDGFGDDAGCLSRAPGLDAQAFLEASDSCGDEPRSLARGGLRAHRDAGRCVWLVSSIVGAGVRVPDIRALARAAAGVGARLIVDNTVATCAGCTPLLLGADAVCEALPVIDGQLGRPAADRSLVFALACGRAGRRGKRAQRGRSRVDLAACSGSHRLSQLRDDELGRVEEIMASAAAREQLRSDRARALAAYLSCHPQVSEVCYPALRSHCDHEIATRVLIRGFGPLIRFDLSLPSAVGPDLLAAFGRGGKSSAGSTLEQLSFGLDELTSMRLTRDAGPESQECSMELMAGTDDPYAVIDSLERAIREVSAR